MKVASRSLVFYGRVLEVNSVSRMASRSDVCCCRVMNTDPRSDKRGSKIHGTTRAAVGDRPHDDRRCDRVAHGVRMQEKLSKKRNNDMLQKEQRVPLSRQLTCEDQR